MLPIARIHTRIGHWHCPVVWLHMAADWFISRQTHGHTPTDTPTHPYAHTVLCNLLSNAVKFTSHGSIDLDVTLDDASLLTISIRDTGVGIPEDMIPNLFQVFAQVYTWGVSQSFRPRVLTKTA